MYVIILLIDIVHCPHLLGQAGVILGAVTIFGILSWYFIPEHKWLRRQQVIRALNATDQSVPSQEGGGDAGTLRHRESHLDSKQRFD